MLRQLCVKPARDNFRPAAQPQAPSPLKAYLSSPHTPAALKAFGQIMKQWHHGAKPLARLLDPKLPKEERDELIVFGQQIRRVFPFLTSQCETMARHHRDAYHAMCNLLHQAVLTHAAAVVAERRNEVHLNRYDPAISIMTDILAFSPPRGRERALVPPIHMLPDSHLDKVLSQALADTSALLFQQMRQDGLKDHVDFLIEKTAHTASRESLYTHHTKSGMRTGFILIYKDVMSSSEWDMIEQSRFYAQNKETQDIINELIRAFIKSITREVATGPDGALFQGHAYVAK